MSLDAAEIDLSKSFVPGQGYVALSRLRNLDGLILRGINETSFAVHPEVFAIDRRLRAASAKWERAALSVSEQDMRQLHEAFVKRAGGTTDEKEIAKNRNRKHVGAKEKLPTHEITKALLKQGLPLTAIAKKRGMVAGTIIAHIEKLARGGADVPMESLRPEREDLEKIRAAFKKTGDTKLAPVYRMLSGAYSYEELRVARLFLED